MYTIGKHDITLRVKNCLCSECAFVTLIEMGILYQEIVGMRFPIQNIEGIFSRIDVWIYTHSFKNMMKTIVVGKPMQTILRIVLRNLYFSTSLEMS